MTVPASCRFPMTPFGREPAQDAAHLGAPPRRGVPSADNGPGDSTPSAMFGWTGLDDRTHSAGAEGTQALTGINAWWTAFDARYMQPVFGGPQAQQQQQQAEASSPRSHL